MKLFFRLLLPVFLLGLCVPAPAETPQYLPLPKSTAQEDEAAVRKVAEDFFARLNAKDVDKAYDELLKGTKIAESASDVSMLKTKTREALEVGGIIQGVDLVGKKRAGNHVMSLTYISRGRRTRSAGGFISINRARSGS